MATRIEQFEIVTPAGTLQTAPITTALTFTEAMVEQLWLTIPSGHAGLTGIAFFHSSVQVIPFKAGTFIKGDGQTMPWELQRFPTGAKWSVRTYNEDVYDHTHHIRLLIQDIPPAGLPPVVEPAPVTPEATEGDLADADQLPTPDATELEQLAEEVTI